jgi:uncharacterized protein YuzE
LPIDFVRHRRPEDAISVETREVSPGIMLDYDAGRRVIGIEVLGSRERVNGTPPAQIAAE